MLKGIKSIAHKEVLYIIAVNVICFAISLKLSSSNLLPWIVSVSLLVPLVLHRESRIVYLCDRAYKDNLTKVYNRDFFYTAINKKKDHGYTAIIMMDVDNFKYINDTHGHLTGDEILKQMATLFKRNIRENDVIVRWGGDEFFLLLNNADRFSLVSTAERVRSSVEKYNFNHKGKNVNVTISVGGFMFNKNANVNSIIEKVDTALYKAKRKRNYVVVAK